MAKVRRDRDSGDHCLSRLDNPAEPSGAIGPRQIAPRPSGAYAARRIPTFPPFYLLGATPRCVLRWGRRRNSWDLQSSLAECRA